MKDFLADYGNVIGPIAAILNGFIALVVAQFFKERTVAAAVLSVGAVTATIATQQYATDQKKISEAHHREIRDHIGTLISEGNVLILNCGDNSKPPNWRELEAWIKRVTDYLNSQLGESYVRRLVSPVGYPVNVACNGADDEHNKFYRIGYALLSHLEQYSTESGSWP
jgi:hypothetical protein